MKENSFKSVGDILKDICESEKEHNHHINRLVQEFGEDKLSEVNRLYFTHKGKVEDSNEFVDYAIPLETYERTRKDLYFSNPGIRPTDSFISEEYI